MKVFKLPDDFVNAMILQKGDVIIRHYQSENNHLNNKIALCRNMINVLLSGTKSVIFPQSRTVVQSHELILLTAGNMLTSEVMTGNEPFSSLILYFTDETMSQFLIKYHHLIASVKSNEKKVNFLHCTQDQFIRQYAESLLALLHSNLPLTAEFKHIKLEELLLYLLQTNAEKFRLLRISMQSQTDLQVKTVIEAHVGELVTIDELAFLCHMSSATFKRKFKQLYNTSPQKWLIQRKLDLAAELLRSPAEHPSNVYLKIGYRNHSSFSQAFKTYHGLTPKEYQYKCLKSLE